VQKNNLSRVVILNHDLKARWSSKDALFLLIIIFLCVILPLIISNIIGSGNIPRVDDWVYSYSSLSFYSNHHFIFKGGSSAILVGQILYSQIFLKFLGPHMWALNLSTCVLSTAGLVGSYYIAKQYLSSSYAKICIFLLIMFPGFSWSTSTFMTDSPAFSASMVCIGVAIYSMKNKGMIKWLAVLFSLVIGTFAFSIRQFAIAAPLAVLWAMFSKAKKSEKFLVALIALLEIAVCAYLYFWWLKFPQIYKHPVLFRPTQSIGSEILAFTTISFFLMPLLILYINKDLFMVRLRKINFVVVAVSICCYAWYKTGGVFLGDYFYRHGLESSLITGIRPNIFPDVIWYLFCVCGILSSLIFLNRIHEASKRINLLHPAESLKFINFGVLETYLLLNFLILFFYRIIFGFEVDRYFWGLLFALAIFVLRDVERNIKVSECKKYVFIFVMFIYSVLSILITINADEYSANVWNAGITLIKTGIHPEKIDAGYDWVGKYSAQGTNSSSSGIYLTNYWNTITGRHYFCGVVTNTKISIHKASLYKVSSFPTFGFGEKTKLYIYMMKGCSN